jgi:hypothetical protein
MSAAPLPLLLFTKTKLGLYLCLDSPEQRQIFTEDHLSEFPVAICASRPSACLVR